MKLPAFEILSREALVDPHSLYAKLREAGPVCKVEHGWLAVTRHADALFVLKHPELFSSTDVRVAREAAVDIRLRGDDVFPESASIIANDPPVHTRLRKLIAGAFTPKEMTRLEPRIRALTTKLLDGIVGKESFDIVQDLAIPLPVTVIAEMLGVDPERQPDFKRWSDDVINVDVVGEHTDDEIARILASRRELRAYVEELLLARRASPRDDMMSALGQADVDADEALSLAITLLIAGNVTTTNLIGTAALALAEWPHVFEALRHEPNLVPRFVDEVLRFDGPAKMLLRRATEDVTIAGVRVEKDTIVAVLLASANRDPAVFPLPNTFDIERDPRGHVAFGFGIHFCVGAALSRLEGRVVFEEIARRLPTFSREPGPLAWSPTLGLRGLTRLPLHFETRVAA
jgi:cytochrome P450